MDINVETFDIAIADGAIRGTVLSPSRRMPGIVFVHGWGGSQKHDLVRAREAAALGCVCLTFDLRGHERTAALHQTVTRQQNLDDLIAAYDRFTRRRDVDPAAIAVVGISYGGYLASLLTTLRPVRWLALRSPAIYADDAWHAPKMDLNRDPGLTGYRKRVLSPADNLALSACARFRGDALLVQAEHDSVVPAPVATSYGLALAGTKTLTTRVIADADHALTDKTHQLAYTQLLIDWLKEMVVETRRNQVAQAIRSSHRPTEPMRGQKA